MGKSPVDSLFTRYVEAGRLVRVRYGPLTGKMCTVVDLVDLKRIVVDGPTTGVKRQMMPIKWIELTDQKCTIERGTIFFSESCRFIIVVSVHLNHHHYEVKVSLRKSTHYI